MAARPDELTLELMRDLPAAPSSVFAAFIDPDELVKWWGPEGFTVPSLEFHPRVAATGSCARGEPVATVPSVPARARPVENYQPVGWSLSTQPISHPVRQRRP